jgi:hypothetical protein
LEGWDVVELTIGTDFATFLSKSAFILGRSVVLNGGSTMREHLKVYTDSHNVVRAEVPCTSMWDLVEYLSFQRTAVTYEYEATHFVVWFPRLDEASAQQILDDWVHSSAGVWEAAC